MDLIELCEKEPSLEKLMDFFNNQNLSDYVVVYLRLLTSGYLQREHGFFQHFIEGGRSVKEFCQQVGARDFFFFSLVCFIRLFCFYLTLSCVKAVILRLDCFCSCCFYCFSFFSSTLSKL